MIKTYLSLIAIDIRLALRQRAVIFFNYLFPLVFFFIFGSVFRASSDVGAAAYVVTMSVTLGGTLANGASVDVQFLLGRQVNGNVRFYIIVEALP